MNSTCDEIDSRDSVTQYLENNGCVRIDDGRERCDEDASAVEIAEFLLEQKLYLTALEYYFEQLERGRRISMLGTFFSNATFFEQIHPAKDDGLFGIVHYQSVSTLDSIDIGRISDDGNNLEEKVKVLEYELRKKNEEIQSLRTELTQLTVGNTASGSIPTTQHTADQRRDVTERPTPHAHSIHLHEIRALGVLINDYLLQNNYRFTAVQFAEESESAGLPSVESWEQVSTVHAEQLTPFLIFCSILLSSVL
ncbi:hypothetical protein PHET_11649 [Paragonimus heterotremus]|uniref:LisH domain-containing protein n=1 Tax=Paragonimus heterotremus TaxID=100268 RepID=A0A8J4T3U7_9TREM|nr:hypothetical protein PHET_11649 [Paragonimus heterotremus]